ncbi:hypothetical protein J4Q44_G00193860 [Coregonus suidteri]|uniref:Uncharacterized protein n=1 Tax=Coregonus suidteri TaxID=861788 RepID=A0AAN8LNS5_9TELE
MSMGTEYIGLLRNRRTSSVVCLPVTRGFDLMVSAKGFWNQCLHLRWAYSAL